MATDYTGGYAKSYGPYVQTGPVVPRKPKRVIAIGDSMAKKFDASVGFTSAFEQTMARLNASAGSSNQIATAQLGNPGETADDFLTGKYGPRIAQFEAVGINTTYDDFAQIVFGTNDINVSPQAFREQRFRDLCAYLRSKGVKKIIAQQVAACKSPYAYARDAQGNIIGSTTADRQAGFDAARLYFNNTFLPSLVRDSTIDGIVNLSGYLRIYPQSQATDALYYQPPGVGQYGNSEPGFVHHTQYGTKYPAEAAAQAWAPLLGITLNPATIVIPDAGISQTLTILSFKPQQPSPQNATVDGSGNLVHKTNGLWDCGTPLNELILKPKPGETTILNVQGMAPTGTQSILLFVAINFIQQGVANSVLGAYADANNAGAYYGNNGGGFLTAGLPNTSTEFSMAFTESSITVYCGSDNLGSIPNTVYPLIPIVQFNKLDATLPCPTLLASQHQASGY